MPDPQQSQAPPPPPGFSPVQDAANVPPPPSGFSPVNQPMVTNTAGEIMPADVAARHARANEHFNQIQVERAAQPPSTWDKITGAVEKVTPLYELATGLPPYSVETMKGAARGAFKEAGKTTMGLENLVSGGAAGRTSWAPEPEELETHGAAETVGGLAEQGMEWAAGDAALEGLAKVAKVAKNAPHLIELIENYPKAAKMLMGTAKAATVGAAEGAVKESAPGGEGAVKGAEHGAEGGAVGGATGEIISAAAKPLLNKLGIATSATEDIMRAAQPGKRNTKFIESWEKAAPRLVKELDENGKFANMEDAANRIREVRQDIWNNEVKPVLDKHGAEIVDTTPVANAVRELSENTALKKNFPEDAKKLEDFANKYTSGSSLFTGDRSVADLEQEIELYNSKLADKGFWTKPASEQAALVKANPEIAAWKTASDAMRDALYDHLETVSKEPGMKDLKQLYGAVSNVEREVRGQVNVAGRARPLSMKQIIGLTAGVIHGGPAGIAAAMLPLADKFYNDPVALLNRGVSKSAPGPVRKAVQQVAKTATEEAGAIGGFAGANGILMMSPDGQPVSVHPEDADKAKKMGFKPIESTPEKP